MTSASASTMSTAEVNEYVWIILGSVAGLAAAGVALDVAVRRFGRERADCPRMWALALLLGSYGCLAPGLVLNLFSVSTSVNVFGQSLELTALSESMIALIHRMFAQRMYTGAILVVLYAFVIPVVKVLLLVLGVCFQLGRRPHLRRARHCIMAVRAVSKWASPDMFAYILIANLFRSINHPPTLSSTADLGVGFTCFCVFCAMSTVASLGLPVPELTADGEGEKTASTGTEPMFAKDDDHEETAASQMELAQPALRRRTTSKLGPRQASADIEAGPSAKDETAQADIDATSSGKDAERRIVSTARIMLSLVLAMAFGVLLGFGIVTPCMTLHMDMDVLYASRPTLKGFAFVIDSLGLPALLNSEVSIRSCLTGLADWIAEGDANGAVAFAMYGVFGVLVPALDVVALLVCALSRGACGAAFRASSALGKLSMLDVAVMGVVVTVLSLRNLRDEGAVVALGPGLAPLIAAEVCHYALALVVPKPAAALAAAAPSACKDDASTVTPSETPSEPSETLSECSESIEV